MFKWELKDNSEHPIIKLAQAHRTWKKADKTYHRKYDEQVRSRTVFGRKVDNNQIAIDEKHELWQAQKDLIKAFTQAIQQVQMETQKAEEATEDPAS